MKISDATNYYVDVPKKTNFHIPENKYRSKIVAINDVRSHKNRCDAEYLKFLLEVDVPCMPKTRNLANATYPKDLEAGSELYKVLSRLLGATAMEDAGGGKLDIGTLVGKEVDIEIEHINTNRRDEYDYPLVKVCGVYPPGTLVKPVAIKPQETMQPSTEADPKK